MTELTITDLFCGAGGSSTGLAGVPGLTVRYAMNHWARAIETHNTNHPDVAHVCADIQQVEPTIVGTTDILWGSPECTNHTVAKGKKRITRQGVLFGEPLDNEAAIKSRATMWDIPRFAEIHDYKLIITENVVDAARWVMFDAWLHAMDSLGYDHYIVYMNSMHAQLGGLPAPQSRDRMYVMFWKKGNRRPDFDRLRPLAYCTSCDETVRAIQVFKKPERWGRYRAQYNYRCPKSSCRNRIVEPGWLPAADAIDWDIVGQRIGDRDKPLAPKTMARIEAGLAKYGFGPLHLEAAGNTYDSTDSRRGGEYFRIWPTEEPFRTFHTTASKGLVIDAVRGAPIVTHTDEPFRTQTTSYTRGLLVPAGGTWNDDARPVTDPMRALTTRDANALLMPYYGSSKPQTVLEPIGTLTTVDRYAMITLRGHNAPKDVSEPLDTFTASGNHHGLMGVVPAVEDCGDDHKAYMARRKRMIELGTYRNHLQDVEPLREHMRMLKRHGIGAVQLSRITGLAERTFWRINFGPDTGRVQARTARKILAVQPDFGESGNGTRIDSTGTRRRLQALIAMGWSQTVLSKEMGLSQGFLRLVHKQPTVRVRTAEVVAAHYDRLWNKPVPPSAMKSRALSMARARGYLSPLAWDDDEIDDPKARPKGQYRESA